MAFLSKPGGVVCKLTPRRGTIFSRAELISIVGVDFKIISLLSDDLLLVNPDYENPNMGVNVLGCNVSRLKIHGPAILVEQQEID